MFPNILDASPRFTLRNMARPPTSREWHGKIMHAKLNPLAQMLARFSLMRIALIRT
jgi:hypothetical protein